MVWLSSKNIKSSRSTKNCLKDGWVLFQSLRNSAFIPTISVEVRPPSLPYFTLRTSQDIKHPKIGIKIFLLQLSSKKNKNEKSLKYCTQSSRGGNYDIWWNGKASFKTQKYPLGNQLRTSRIVLNS
ncbi:hypothetical protein O181_008503 [Austropuccinia psidii MF-1]|uniref:Uncharacterized protein n=1 Tax=Austropuccinia psidii MF-1 TaxID=1389203 RepID=A0A9Q3GIK0_9BASI|nr:hypothetical protein [Austropuccinia psidii MF-1]